MITAQNRRSHSGQRSVSRVLDFTVDEVTGNIKDIVKDMTMVNDNEDSMNHLDHHFAGMTANPLSRTDTVREITDILKSEPQDRSKHEVDILVRYFQNLQIMDEDVGQWVGQDTFRALIQRTRYQELNHNDFVYKKGDAEHLCFYFILKGTVTLGATAEHEEEDFGQNYVFGQSDLFHNESRQRDCIVTSTKGVHLAYWEEEAYDEYIRPIQVLQDDLKGDKRLLYDKKGVILPENELIERASMFLDDSIHGREFKMHRNGKWPKRIHFLLNRQASTVLFCTVALMWMFMAQFEPPSTLRDNDPKTTTNKNIMLL